MEMDWLTEWLHPSISDPGVSLESHMSLWEKMDALRRWRSVGTSGFHFEPFSSSKPAIIEPFSVSAPLLMLSLKPLELLQLLLPCRSDRAGWAGPGAKCYITSNKSETRHYHLNAHPQRGPGNRSNMELWCNYNDSPALVNEFQKRSNTR